jgi:FkbM family methyltransferase
MYSQNNEEEIIVSYFKDQVGTFLEIGSYDPFKFSNTRRLYELGWSGTYVEPSKLCFKSFEDEYKNESRIELLNVAVGDRDGEVDFYESSGDAVSSTSIQHVNKWSNYVKFAKTIVPMISLVPFLESKNNIDFLSFDVEGTNYQLFSLFPDSFLNRVKMICIEHDTKHKEILEKCSKYGFKQLGFNGENLIIAKG